MSNAERGRGVIDLRKRHAGAQVRAARARAQAELPLHHRISLRSRRRKLRALMAFVVLVIGVGAVYGLSVLTYLPQYTIKEVSVGGAENIPPRLVQAFIETQLNDGSYNLLSRDNIFLYPKADIAKSVSGYFPRILSAQISRDAPMAQVINVAIVERQPFALWCSEAGNCFDMDNGGFIFAESATSTSTGTVVFKGGLATSTPPIGQTFLLKKFEEALTLLSHLKDGGFSPTSVSIENEQDFAVSLTRGFIVRASFGGDANVLVRNLQDVLSSDALRGKENKIEYVDLRFGNRVYYKSRQ